MGMKNLAYSNLYRVDLSSSMRNSRPLHDTVSIDRTWEDLVGTSEQDPLALGVTGMFRSQCSPAGNHRETIS